ncbi:MAG: hypothetical protein KIT31_18690 [Deltaproteobacteria bacterium]|nr:hypothetical protein [Deltaproteobacteria bacterium]
MAGPYTPDDITVIGLPEVVRRRPGMYLGDLANGAGRHRMLWEVVGHAVDEHDRFGTTGHVRITLEGDTATVDTDGRGLPLDEVELLAMRMNTHPQARIPRVVHLVGASLALANALSSRFEIEIRRDGRAHVQRYERGLGIGPLEDRGATTRTGTRVTFEPDVTVLLPHPWDVAAIAAHARELAALCAPLTFIVDGEAACYPDGLADHVRHLTRGRRIVEPLHVRGEVDGIRVEAAIAWVEGDAPARLEGHVNFHRCTGAHVDGLRAGIRRALARRLGRQPTAGVERGLVAVVHAVLARARFTSERWDACTNAEAGPAVQHVVEEGIDAAATSHPTLDALLARLA